MSEKTKRLIALYKKDYKVPSKEFAKEYIAQDDQNRMQLLNNFIYHDVKWRLENNIPKKNKKWIARVTTTRERHG